MECKIDVFISCAQEDEDLCSQLQMQLRILERNNLINIWHRGMINPGDEYEKERDEHLHEAHIILLLVSQYFVNADDCYQVEMERAMRKHYSGETRVIPILLRPMNWEVMEFAQLQVLPTNKRPITSWPDRYEAFSRVVEGIRKVIEELRPPSFTETTNNSRLYNSLVRLDYKEQMGMFQHFKNEKRQIGAFLVHGAPSHGQGWLVNRLVMSLPNNTSALCFNFGFERKASGRSLRDLWSGLARWVGLKYPSIPIGPYSSREIVGFQQEIIKRVYELWQRQTVVLTLGKLHEVVEAQYINKFMQEFWLPLAGMASSNPRPVSKYYLLMFLVDNADYVDKWNLQSATQFDQARDPSVLVRLQKLTQFSHRVLDDWIEFEVDTLPADLTAQNILDNSENGIPEFVLDHICGLFGCEWHELVKYRV